MKALADSLRQNEGQPTALDLLVLAHGGQNGVDDPHRGRDIADARRQADRAQMRLDPLASCPGQRPSRREKRNAHAMPTATPSP